MRLRAFQNRGELQFRPCSLPMEGVAQYLVFQTFRWAYTIGIRSRTGLTMPTCCLQTLGTLSGAAAIAEGLHTLAGPMPSRALRTFSVVRLPAWVGRPSSLGRVMCWRSSGPR